MFAETPPDSPAENPGQVLGWVHYHDPDGNAWGCRFRAEAWPGSDRRQALGFLEFFSPEAPTLTRNQRIELFAGRQRMLIVDVLNAGEVEQ